MEKFIQQQPKPLPPLQRSHASFLEDLVDPLPSSPAPKRDGPESIHCFVTQWLESTSGSESYRERHCRWDTLLGSSDGDIIPRRLTKSAPNMEYRRDLDGFTLPSTPPFRPTLSVTPSHSSRTSGISGRKSLVEKHSYRRNNLAENNIYMRPFCEEFPVDIAGLVNHIRKDRDSPGPSPDQVEQNERLDELEMGTAEADVEMYFNTRFFPTLSAKDVLQRTNKNPMAKHAVPNVESKLKVSTPVPDMIYGYNGLVAFAQQQPQMRSMGDEIFANTQNLLYPFLFIEYKGDGPGGSGSMWVATNQCLGGSASCVNMAEHLNRQLRQCKNEKVQLIESAAFSIAMSGTEARLYISWKHDEVKYYMRKIQSFVLQEPDQYAKFHKYVLNIIDWGKGQRLKQIRDSLDVLLEDSRKTASKLAKSRQPPLDDSINNSSHKRRS